MTYVTAVDRPRPRSKIKGKPRLVSRAFLPATIIAPACISGHTRGYTAASRHGTRKMTTLNQSRLISLRRDHFAPTRDFIPPNASRCSGYSFLLARKSFHTYLDVKFWYRECYREIRQKKKYKLYKSTIIIDRTILNEWK